MAAEYDIRFESGGQARGGQNVGEAGESGRVLRDLGGKVACGGSGHPGQDLDRRQ